MKRRLLHHWSLPHFFSLPLNSHGKTNICVLGQLSKFITTLMARPFWDLKSKAVISGCTPVYALHGCWYVVYFRPMFGVWILRQLCAWRQMDGSNMAWPAIIYLANHLAGYCETVALSCQKISFHFISQSMKETTIKRRKKKHILAVIDSTESMINLPLITG